MKIFSPDMVADVKRQDSEGDLPMAVVLHDHSNKSVLDKFSIAGDGSLMFDEKNVGSAFANSELLIASYGSSSGDLGLAHVQGDYNATNVKNKTSTPMSVVLKVYDGAL